MTVGAPDLRLSVVLALSGAEVAVITARPEDTVRTLKKRVRDAEGTAPAEQRLLSGSRVLSNGQTVADACLCGGCVLQLIRLPPVQRAGARTGGRVIVAHAAGVHADVDSSSEPTDDDVDAYAERLGMDPDADGDLLWIARDGLKAPLEHPWRAFSAPNRQFFYFNFETGQTSWEHPVDDTQRSMYQKLKAAKNASQPWSTPGQALGADGVPRESTI